MAKRKLPVNSLSFSTAPAVSDLPVGAPVPKRFTLAGLEWTVEDINHLPDLGECDRDAATIRLRAGLSPQVRSATFYHELVHAIKFTAGLTEHSEQQVDIFGNLLHQFELTKA
jgi:hypothetical protein